jgi:hypothetical protein
VTTENESKVGKMITDIQPPFDMSQSTKSSSTKKIRVPENLAEVAVRIEPENLKAIDNSATNGKDDSRNKETSNRTDDTTLPQKSCSPERTE